MEYLKDYLKAGGDDFTITGNHIITADDLVWISYAIENGHKFQLDPAIDIKLKWNPQAYCDWYLMAINGEYQYADYLAVILMLSTGEFVWDLWFDHMSRTLSMEVITGVTEVFKRHNIISGPLWEIMIQTIRHSHFHRQENKARIFEYRSPERLERKTNSFRDFILSTWNPDGGYHPIELPGGLSYEPKDLVWASYAKDFRYICFTPDIETLFDDPNVDYLLMMYMIKIRLSGKKHEISEDLLVWLERYVEENNMYLSSLNRVLVHIRQSESWESMIAEYFGSQRPKSARAGTQAGVHAARSGCRSSHG